MTTPDYRLATLLREFKAWGVMERQWRLATCTTYAGVARRCDAFIKANKLAPGVVRAGPQDYRAFLWSVPETTASRSAAVKALTAFGDFLLATGRRTKSPAATLPKFRTKPGVPKALEAEQAAAIIRAARQGPVWDALVLLLFYAGLRMTEVRTLRWDQVEGRWMRVDGKGGVTRDLPRPRGRGLRCAASSNTGSTPPTCSPPRRPATSPTAPPRSASASVPSARKPAYRACTPT